VAAIKNRLGGGSHPPESIWARVARRLTPQSRSHSRQAADLEPVAGSVQSALQPVEISHLFRETLRDNLEYAAQRQRSGVSVEYPRPIRQLVWLTLSMGAVVATVTTVLLVKHGQPRAKP